MSSPKVFPTIFYGLAALLLIVIQELAKHFGTEETLAPGVRFANLIIILAFLLGRTYCERLWLKHWKAARNKSYKHFRNRGGYDIPYDPTDELEEEVLYAFNTLFAYDITAISFWFNGEVIAHDMHVLHKITIEGTLRGSRISCRNITVSGSAEVKYLTASHSAVFNQSAAILSSILPKTIIEGSSFVFSDTILESLTIIPKKGLHSVVLCRNTVINSDIIFEGKPGIIDAEESVIIRGNVINGSVRHCDLQALPCIEED